MKKAARSRLTRLADAAFRVAARRVIERAEATGTPVIIWQDGGIQAVPPSRLRSRKIAGQKGSSKRH
jgi:hypothetical protein